MREGMASLAPVVAKESPILPAANELIWGTVAFLVLLVILWRAGVSKQIRHMLVQRRERIQGNIEKAEQERQEAERLLEEYREQLEKARDEADAIVREAREAADRLGKELQQRAREEAERIVESAR